jgi:environmental stress-induced protein Ves
VGGPVLDLNVMVRRDRYAAGVQRTSTSQRPVPAATCLLVALSAGRVLVGTGEWHLTVHDALLLQAETGSALAAQGASALISFSPC